MARIHTKRKGKSGSKRPFLTANPEWVTTELAEVEVPEENRLLVPLRDVLVHDVDGPGPGAVRFRARRVPEERHDVRAGLREADEIAERSRGDLDREDVPLGAHIRHVAHRGPARGPEVQDRGRRREGPHAAAPLQVCRELAPVRVPPTVLDVALAMQRLAVHAPAGREVPGVEPRAVRVHAVDARGSDRHMLAVDDGRT